MKKFLALIIAIMMMLSIAACGGAGDSGTTGGGGGTTAGGNGGGGGTTAGGNGGGGGTTVNGPTQAQMEAEILRRLSAISELKSLTLCGGDSIKYTEDGIFFAGDYWIITNPSMGYDEFMASVKTQLTAAGFIENQTLLGTEYTVKAGTSSIGISIMYDEGEITLRTTNHRDEYTKAFIDAENAKLPTIIEGIDIIEKLPENFSITFTGNIYKYVVCRYNGGYYVSTESLDQEGSDYYIVSYYTAVPQTGGSYEYYHWYDSTSNFSGKFDKGKPQKVDYFMNTSSMTLEENINKIFENLSLWNRMSWDYKGLPVDGDRFIFDKASYEYRINENMTKTGTETFLGLNCEKVHSEGLWADTFDIIFDLETGMVMKMTVSENGINEPVTYVEVTEYNTNPTSLGTFVQP